MLYVISELKPEVMLIAKYPIKFTKKTTQATTELCDVVAKKLTT